MKNKAADRERYERFYQRISAPFQMPGAGRALVLANKALTVIGYVAYPALLVMVALAGAWLDLVKFVAVPAVGFIALSVFRARYNAPRPYQVAAIDPIIKKDTEGKSFPSRHTFSLFMIALSWVAWNVPAGIVLVVFACIMAATRVIGGVHFPRDVVAAVIFALVCALVGYVLIPW